MGRGPDRPNAGEGWTRREVLRSGLLGWVAVAGSGRSAMADGPGADREPGPGLIVRNPRPLDAEAPVEAFDRWLTPNDLFFVRSHFGPPAVELLEPWRVEVGGLVDRPLRLGLEDLGRLEPVRLPAVLQCSGNGRGLFSPKVPGVGWGRGAVGNAEWEGVRLADVLERAGVREGAAHVQLRGADPPPSPKTPPFFRSIPLARALDRSTLLATRMNGEPLPVLHGGPLRLIVPTWTGNHWMKWVRSITVAREEAPGFYQQKGYRIPKSPPPPGREPDPSDLVPLTAMNVKSLISRPTRGAKVPRGGLGVVGVAWTGEGTVDRVEVAIDDGPWQPARLEGPDQEGTWRLWRFDWQADRPGRHEVRARATDTNGRTQPEATAWNKSGYLWNGIDRVQFEVG